MKTTNFAVEQSQPASVEAERAILGAILLNNDIYYGAAATLSADEFFVDSHKRIYRAMCALGEDSSGIDLVTLTEELRRRKEIEAVGGITYVSSLTDGLPQRDNVEHYLEIVRSKAQLRALIHACNSAIGRAMEQSDEAKEILADAQTQLLEVLAHNHKPQAVRLSVALDELFAVMRETRKIAGNRKAAGLKTGLDKLDAMTTGYHLGETTVIGGSTAEGKSSLALQCIRENLRDDVACCFFTIEMLRRQIAARLLAREADVLPTQLRDSRLLENLFDIEQVNKHKKLLATLPLFLDETSDLSVDEIVMRARMHARRDNVKLVIVDFLQLVNVPRAQSAHERISTAMKRLRDFGKAENVHMLILSQITVREGKKSRPNKFALRESGDIASFANNIILCWRPQDESGNYIGGDELIVDKQREGATGKIDVRYDTKKLLFEER